MRSQEANERFAVIDPYGTNSVMLIDGIDVTHVSRYGFPNANRFSLPRLEHA